MMQVSKTWMWTDELEMYRFEDGKIKPQTMKGYNAILRIVRPQFATLFIVRP